MIRFAILQVHFGCLLVNRLQGSQNGCGEPTAIAKPRDICDFRLEW